MIKVIKPEYDDQNEIPGSPRIFLAGSIEMGVAVNWQDQTINTLVDKVQKDVTIYNPRRDDWDSSWISRMSNPQFNYQVNWELDHIMMAHIVFMVFCGDTKSPITLLELGLLNPQVNNQIVVCPDNFWRKGNVEVVCHRKAIPLYDNLDAGLEALTKHNRLV